MGRAGRGVFWKIKIIPRPQKDEAKKEVREGKKLKANVRLYSKAFKESKKNNNIFLELLIIPLAQVKLLRLTSGCQFGWFPIV